MSSKNSEIKKINYYIGLFFIPFIFLMYVVSNLNNTIRFVVSSALVQTKADLAIYKTKYLNT